MLPVLRIIYQSCSPRSPPSTASSATSLANNVPALVAALGGEHGEQLKWIILSTGSVVKIEIDRDQERGRQASVHQERGRRGEQNPLP